MVVAKSTNGSCAGAKKHLWGHRGDPLPQPMSLRVKVRKRGASFSGSIFHKSYYCIYTIEALFANI